MAEGQGRSSRQELKLLYLRDYFYKYTNKDNPKRMDAILKFLAVNGIPATRVTIYNDIDILRNTLHIPIKYSAKHYGYYVEKPQFESHEMLMLLDCIRFSTFITEDESERLRQKVMALASVYDAELVNNVAPEETHVLKASVSIYDNLRILLDAIRQGKKISFVMLQYVADRSYTSKSSSSPLIVSPHRLELQNGKYVFFYSSKLAENVQRMATSKNLTIPDKLGAYLQAVPNAYEELEISKMSSIQIIDEPSIYAVKRHRNAKEESEKALDKRKGTKRAITIWFSNRVLERVALELGKDAILLPADRDGFTTTIRRRPDARFRKWIQSFGGNAEVIAPEGLVEKPISPETTDMHRDHLHSYYTNRLGHK